MQSKEKKQQHIRRMKSIPLRSVEDTAPLPETAEHWAITTTTPPSFTTSKETANAFFARYRRIACEDRHLTLIAPAPLPEASQSWGLRHLLASTAQLRGWFTAALRLSAICKISLLLPQPSLAGDLQAAKMLLEETMLSLSHNRTDYDDLMSIGVTLSTPGALLDAATLCEEADFAVIDTDTLLRLTLAAEPGTPLLEELLSHGGNALWRLLEAGIELLHRIGRFVAVSGRLADDLLFEEMLISVGADAVLTRPQPHRCSTAFLI